MAKFKELNANGTFNLAVQQGILHKIVVNVPGGATIQVFDNASGAASGPAIVGATAAALPAAGSVLAYEASFSNGLVIVIATMTSGSVTVVFD